MCVHSYDSECETHTRTHKHTHNPHTHRLKKDCQRGPENICNTHEAHRHTAAVTLTFTPRFDSVDASTEITMPTPISHPNPLLSSVSSQAPIESESQPKSIRLNLTLNQGAGPRLLCRPGTPSPTSGPRWRGAQRRLWMLQVCAAGGRGAAAADAPPQSRCRGKAATRQHSRLSVCLSVYLSVCLSSCLSACTPNHPLLGGCVHRCVDTRRCG